MNGSLLLLNMKIQIILKQKGTLEKIEGTKLWKVVSPYIWEIRNWSCRTIKIPIGFITDFGSIPRILWSVFNPTEFHTYILHDYLYQYKPISRSLADTALQLWLISEGCDGLSALLVWVGVRIGWWLYFNNKTNTNDWYK